MMRLARRVSLLVAFYLLTSATMASAECAWIMWWGDRNPWQPVRAYSTLKACEADLPHGTARTAWAEGSTAMNWRTLVLIRGRVTVGLIVALLAGGLILSTIGGWWILTPESGWTAPSLVLCVSLTVAWVAAWGFIGFAWLKLRSIRPRSRRWR